MVHQANNIELALIDKVVQASELEFALVRITKTMLNKSIIDANKSMVNLLRQFNYFDYNSSIDGEITYLPIKILTHSSWIINTTSLYRPKAKTNKQGDPRFWPKGIKSVVSAGDLLLVTVHNNCLILIPLLDELVTQDFLNEEFPKQNIEQLLENLNKEKPSSKALNSNQDIEGSKTYDNAITQSLDKDVSIAESHRPYSVNNWLENLISKIRENVDQWILSCSPTKNNPKDVGDTLEAEFGLNVNNDSKADYNGIELKTKRRLSKTADTLFSQIPEEELTPLKSVKDIILNYGYPSRHPKRLGYKDLFVTVSNKPNPQGLYLVVNEESQVVEMRSTGQEDKIPNDHLVAGWSFNLLKKRLFEKHPITAWILASEKNIDGKFYFKYDGLEISKTPVFSQFLLLIERGIVVYDWRGGYHPEGKGRVDKGHPFRLKGVKNRKLLFGELKVINLKLNQDSVSIKRV